MIIELSGINPKSPVLIDDNSICGIAHNTISGSFIWLYGQHGAIEVSESFEEMNAVFVESRKRDRFTGEMPKKSEQKKFGVAVVGDHKFQLDIRTSEFEDGLHSTLQLDANFPVKNDAIQTIVEMIIGVERYSEYSFSKYNGSITIGKLFDAETVRGQVEEKIKEYLKHT